MRTPLIFFLTSLAFASSPPQTPQPPLSKELQSLQGTWTTAQVNDRVVEPKDPIIALVVVGNRYSQTVDGKVTERGEIRLDASKTPMAVTLVIAEGDDASKTQVGVMKIEGVTLTMKLNAPGEPTRPTDFTLADGYIVAVLIRTGKLSVQPGH